MTKGREWSKIAGQDMFMPEQPPAPEPRSARRAVRSVFILASIGMAAWVVAIFLAPYLRSRSLDASASFLYAVFSPVCHQIPERSFFFRGFPLAVCARCLGVYAGFLAGLVLYPFVRGFSRTALPSARLFLVLTLPVGLDFAGGFFGLWNTPNGLRFATGFIWGLLLPFYFITGVAELILWRASRRAGTGAAQSPGTGDPCARLPLDVVQGLDNWGEKNVK
jgi:uncharacterized membrane protein